MRRTAIGQSLRAGPNAVSRRRFFGMSAGAAGVMSSGLWTPARADRDDDDRDEDAVRHCPEQSPIPHVNMAAGPQTFGAFHFFFPGPVDGSPALGDPEPAAAHAAGRDPSLIFDFEGVIGQADLDLEGTGTDTTGRSAHYGFHTDMRFMKGRFVGTDGRVHRGAFAFI
jgi:hypothetical protein